MLWQKRIPVDGTLSILPWYDEPDPFALSKRELVAS